MRYSSPLPNFILVPDYRKGVLKEANDSPRHGISFSLFIWKKALSADQQWCLERSIRSNAKLVHFTAGYKHATLRRHAAVLQKDNRLMRCTEVSSTRLRICAHKYECHDTLFEVLKSRQVWVEIYEYIYTHTHMRILVYICYIYTLSLFLSHVAAHPFMHLQTFMYSKSYIHFSCLPFCIVVCVYMLFFLFIYVCVCVRVCLRVFCDTSVRTIAFGNKIAVIALKEHTLLHTHIHTHALLRNSNSRSLTASPHWPPCGTQTLRCAVSFGATFDCGTCGCAVASNRQVGVA